MIPTSRPSLYSTTITLDSSRHLTAPPPPNFGSDLELDLSDCNDSLSNNSGNQFDNLDELLSNPPPQQPNLPLTITRNSRSSSPDSPDMDTSYDPFWEDEELSTSSSQDESVDVSSLPTIPEPHGRCRPINSNMPVSPVRNITQSAMHQKSLEGMSSVHDRMMLKLILMLDSFRAPQYAFQKVLHWVDECLANGLLQRGLHGRTFSPMKRDTFMKQLEKLFPDVTKPVQATVAIEESLNSQFHSGLAPVTVDANGTTSQELIDEYRRSTRSTAIVPHFNARQQIISLLSDSSLFGDPDNLYVNQTGCPDDLFRPYSCEPGRPISSILSGSWYQRTVRAPDFDPSREFIIPLIGYIDATGTDAYSRFKLEPFLISFTIFKPNILGKSQSWRLLGIVPDLELDSSARKSRQRNNKNNDGKAIHCRNYHNMLRFTLSSLIELQKTGLEYNLRIGNYEKRVRIRFPIAFISGDGKSNNMLSGRYTSHQSMVLRQCRACLVHRDQLTNTTDECFKIPQEIPWFLVQHLHNLVERGSNNVNQSRLPIHNHAATASSTSVNESTPTEADECSDSANSCPEDSDPGNFSSGDSQSDSHDGHSTESSSDELFTASDVETISSEAANQGTESDHLKQFRALLACRKKLLSITSSAKQSMTIEEREKLHDKKNSIRHNLFHLCSEMIQEVVGKKPLNNLSRKRWIRVRHKIWHWANCLSLTETKEVLRVIAQYESRLATHELDYGTDRYGINMCTPTDLMHAFLLGVVRYACQSMMDVWPPRLRATIDGIVDSNIRCQMQQERAFFPRADFSKGVTNLTQLTAQEWVGLCFTLYLGPDIWRRQTGC